MSCIFAKVGNQEFEINSFLCFLFWRNRDELIKKVFLLIFVIFIRLEIDQTFWQYVEQIRSDDLRWIELKETIDYLLLYCKNLRRKIIPNLKNNLKNTSKIILKRASILWKKKKENVPRIQNKKIHYRDHMDLTRCHIHTFYHQPQHSTRILLQRGLQRDRTAGAISCKPI